jgi:hypothetical protein
MRAPGIVDHWRCLAPMVFLISVLGVLFVWPLRAAPAIEPEAFRIEIDLGNSAEWTIRASGPMRVGADGTFQWPFRQEGFSQAVTASVSHWKMGGNAEARHFFPAPGASGDAMPSPAELGYAPGDRVHIAFVRRIRPLAGTGLDQAFVFPGSADSSPVLVEVNALHAGIGLSQVGLIARGGLADLRGERKLSKAASLARPSSR